MTLVLNLAIIWMVVSFFGITAIAYKRRFITTSLKTGKFVPRTNLSTRTVKIGIVVSTLIFAVLFVGELLFSVFRTSKPIPELVGQTILVILVVAGAAVIYCCVMLFLFKQADVERKKELKKKMRCTEGGE